MNLHDREETIETICSECNNNIGELEDFLNHIEIKHSEDCDECSLSFIDEICLNIHVKSDHPRKELTCCQCGKDFGDAEVEYESHIGVNRKYNCNFL